MASVIVALVGGVSLSAVYWPGAVGCAVSVVLILALAELVFFLAQKILRRLLGHSLGWLLALASAGYAVADTLWRGSGDAWDWRVYLSAGVVVVLLWLLAASWYQMLVARKRTPTTVGTSLMSAALTVVLILLLSGDGFGNDYIDDYLALSDGEPLSQSSLEQSLTAGPYRVEMLDYGPEEALQAGTVDLTRYMSRGDDGLTDHYVDAYWEYEISEIPMHGRVWYPAEAENCPVLVIAHGNHHIATESYLGYDYLGKYLASHGYVVVSVDQNACNMLSNENDGRAVLLLEHIGLLQRFAGEEGNPLFNRLDNNNIAIAGHSRGGEMVATACLFNEYDRYPEHGGKEFHYNYAIKSVIAIAPTVNQYKPADHSVELEDVNYLLLHGAEDRDVTEFNGMSQYENISFTGEGNYIKSALCIAGANHGQFNALWGQYDQIGPSAALLNTASLISETDQQQIAKVFIKIFLDVTLRGDESCKDLLTDWSDYAYQLPQTVYAQCYETSDMTVIADFEEDSDLESVTMEGVSADGSGFNWWTEDLLDFAGKSAYDTHALRLRWSSRAMYTLTLPETDLTDVSLHFDICDLDEAAVEQEEYSLVNGKIILTDADGNTATVQIADHASIYPIWPVKTDKLDYIFNTCTYQKAFSTVSIPVSDFAVDGDTFDAATVCQIAWRFTNGGQVAVDNIGLVK